MSIHHERTSEVVCPHCGYEDKNSYMQFEGNFDDYATTESECYECEKPFEITMSLSVHYSTKIIP